mmetsp:Transcript_27911/g.54534  ORF Transcript_27911/g.54534 Transcript_27911/m.54534 type:complete len:276 (+) Transcript_27911:159-986(+)
MESSSPEEGSMCRLSSSASLNILDTSSPSIGASLLSPPTSALTMPSNSLKSSTPSPLLSCAMNVPSRSFCSTCDASSHRLVRRSSQSCSRSAPPTSLAMSTMPSCISGGRGPKPYRLHASSVDSSASAASTARFFFGPWSMFSLMFSRRNMTPRACRTKLERSSCHASWSRIPDRYPKVRSRLGVSSPLDSSPFEPLRTPRMSAWRLVSAMDLRPKRWIRVSLRNSGRLCRLLLTLSSTASALAFSSMMFAISDSICCTGWGLTVLPLKILGLMV